MEPVDKVRKHIPYLDSLRGIAALIVVLHHACLQFNFSGYHLNFFQRSTLFWFQNGHYSVDFFIVLSGYCLMLPVIRNNYYLNGGALIFFKKRAKRILPPYYFTILISIILILFLIGNHTGSHWDLSIPVTFSDVLTHVLLIQDVFVTTCSKINHVLWSISVEWRMYFIFPLLLLLWRKQGPGMTVLAVALTSLLLTYALQYEHDKFSLLNNGVNGLVPHYLLLFTLGMLGADISLSSNGSLNKWSMNSWSSMLVVATLLLIIATVLNKMGVAIYWQLLDIVVGFWSLCLLTLCNRIQATTGRPLAYLNAIVNWQPLVFIGTFAYSLYLIHAPLLQVIWQYALVPLQLNPFTGFLLLGSVGLLIILFSSYLFFLLFEKPFISNRQTAPVVGVTA